MVRTAIGGLLLAAVASAQVSTVSLLLLDTDPQTLVATVISSNPSTTEYLVGCPTGTDQNDCGYNPPETVKHAGSVYGASLTAAAEQFTLSYECTVFTTSDTSAVCTTSVAGAAANFPGSGTTTLTGTDVSFLPVTILSGANQIATATSATGTTSGTSGTSGTSAKSSKSASASAASTATSNNAPTAGVGIGLAGLAAVALAL